MHPIEIDAKTWQVELEFDFQREAGVMDRVADNLKVTHLNLCYILLWNGNSSLAPAVQ